MGDTYLWIISYGKIWLVLHLLKRLYLGCCRDDLDKILRRHYQMMDVWEGCRALHRYFKPQLYQIAKSWFCVQVCKNNGRQHSDSSRREFIISSRAVLARCKIGCPIFLSFFLSFPRVLSYPFYEERARARDPGRLQKTIWREGPSGQKFDDT